MRTAAAVALGGLGGLLVSRRSSGRTVWQIDTASCVQCERCATECVLAPSAIKCVHAFDVCGYCDLCGGYLRQGAREQSTAAEVRLCPTGALLRRFVEEPYFEYTVHEELCIGCGRCVKGCAAFGNGSLYLQVRHDRCLGCNECSVAAACPADAFRRVDADSPYLLRGAGSGSGA
jgi:electron transport complex protein RnfB